MDSFGCGIDLTCLLEAMGEWWLFPPVWFLVLGLGIWGWLLATVFSLMPAT